MKRHTLFTFLILFFITESHAQDMRPGYVVLSSNDTLRGYIDYLPNDQLINSCRFSENEKVALVQYEPDQVKSFRYDQDKLMIAKEKYFEPDEYEDGQLVFYEQIVRGRASLYKLNNDYYLEKDTSFIKLKNEKMTISNENGTFEKESKDYLKALGFYMADCPDLREQVFSVDLSEKSLTRIIRKYNDCQESNYSFFKGEKAGFELEYAPYAGYEMTFFNNKPGNFEHYYLDANPNYSGFQLGIKAYISNPRLSEQFALSVGLGYLNWSADYSYSVRKTFNASIRNRWEHTELDIKMSMLEIPIGIQYRIGGAKSKIYINGGASLNFVMAQSYEATHIWQYDDDIFGTVIQPDNPAAWPFFLLTFRSFQPNFWFGPQVIVLDNDKMKFFISSDVKFGSFVLDEIDRFLYTSTFIGVDCSVGVIF